MYRGISSSTLRLAKTWDITWIVRRIIIKIRVRLVRRIDRIGSSNIRFGCIRSGIRIITISTMDMKIKVTLCTTI